MAVQLEGWKIKQEYLDGPGKGLSKPDLIKALLKVDLKETRCPSLPSELQKNESNQLPTPAVLQITNLRNVSAPKANQESKGSPRLIRVTLTDGINFIQGLEVQHIQSLSLRTPPGTKIKLTGAVPLVSGYLFLTPSNTTVLGGIVPELYSKWEMSQNVSSLSRSFLNADGSGPPPWIPFGEKLEGLDNPQKNFKSLKNTVTNIKENDEFRKQRDEAVQELAKETGNKVFGGGKQMLDTNVQKIIKAGFTIEEAHRALARSRNDLPKAMRDLKMMAQGMMAPPEEGRTRGRGRGKRGRGRRGDNDFDDMDAGATRPSAPATLCDYLETKLNLPQPKEEPPKMSSFAEAAYKEAYAAHERTTRGRGRGRGRGESYSNRGSRGSHTPSMKVDYWPELGMETEVKSTETANQKSFGSQPSYTNQNKGYQRNTQHNDQKSYKNNDYSQEYGSSGHYQDYGYKEQRNNGYDSHKDTNQSYRGRRNQDQGYQGQRNQRGENRQQRRSQNYQDQGPQDQRNQQERSQNYHDQGYQDQRNQRRETYQDQRTKNYDDQGYQGHRNQNQGYQTHRTSNDGDRNPDQSYQSHKNSRQNDQSYGNHGYQGHRTDDYQRSYDSTKLGSSVATGNSDYTSKQKDLISQFKQSMIMSGLYEEEDAYVVNSKNERSDREYTRNTYDSGHSHRGGRRGRGRGRY